MSIKKRICLSFFLLVLLFVINGVVTLITLNNNKKLARNISEVIDPSLEATGDFHDMMVESKMYSTNWVFLRYSQEDKDALIKLHKEDYPKLKLRLKQLSSQWENKLLIDSLNVVCAEFEQVLFNEEYIINSLKNFEDYDDPGKKLGAQEQLELIVLPKTLNLLKSTDHIISLEKAIRDSEHDSLDYNSSQLRFIILLMAFSIILLGIFLSFYMSRIIITPINKIRSIVNDLGKGIIRRVNHKAKGDEIGEMILSVNNLSEKLNATAIFATEVGNRNFKAHHEPLSADDTLGKALNAMRDNLKSSDESLNQAQRVAHLGNWERNAISNKVNFSDEMYSILDLEEVFDNFSLVELIHPDDKDYSKDLFAKFLIDKKPLEFECRIITPKGNTKHISIQIDCDVDEKGQLIRTFGIIQDITKRKSIEVGLIESEKHNRNLFNQSTVGLALVRMDGSIEDINETYANILGYTIEETKKLIYTDITPELYHESDKVKMKDLITSGRYNVFEKEYIHKNGHLVPVRLSGVLIEKEGFKYVLSSVEDITESRKTQNEILRKNSELEKTNHELDKFVYSVSHDLRAPLSSMLGIVAITEEETLDKFVLNHLGMLKGSINKLDGFILDILEYSRNSRVEVIKEEIKFKEMLNDITDHLKYMSGSNRIVDIIVDIHEENKFMSDKNRINAVLNNLISNAIRYQNPSVDDPFVNIKIDMSDTETNIVIKDNGIGINKENINKIFDMFYRVSSSSVGSGLGLYIVKETIDKLNGNIKVESEPGVGTIFELSIPNLIQ